MCTDDRIDESHVEYAGQVLDRVIGHGRQYRRPTDGARAEGTQGVTVGRRFDACLARDNTAGTGTVLGQYRLAYALGKILGKAAGLRVVGAARTT